MISNGPGASPALFSLVMSSMVAAFSISRRQSLGVYLSASISRRLFEESNHLAFALAFAWCMCIMG